jgi:lauroyl/myristoyl acyltransferase
MSIQRSVSNFTRRGRVAASLATGYVVGYEAGRPLMRRLSHSSLLQSTIFAGWSRHLRGNGPAGRGTDLAQARSRFILKSLGARLQLVELGRLPGDAPVPWLTVQGVERFEEAARRGPVVLVSSHFGAARVAVLALARRGHRLLSLEAWGQQYKLIDPRVRSHIDIEVLRLKGAFPARAVLAARRRLGEGGVVHLTGDGATGDPDVVLPICGRMRGFRSTFAALAVDAGATTIAAFVPVDEDGRVRVEFLEPFDPGPACASRQNRIHSLLRQYADALEQRWLADPGNVHRHWWTRTVEGIKHAESGDAP